MEKFIITPAENDILYINNMKQYNWLGNHKLDTLKNYNLIT